MRVQLAAREAREAWPSGVTGLPDPCCVPEEHRAWPPWGSRQSGSGLAGRATIISLSSGFLGGGGQSPGKQITMSPSAGSSCPGTGGHVQEHRVITRLLPG